MQILPPRVGETNLSGLEKQQIMMSVKPNQERGAGRQFEPDAVPAQASVRREIKMGEHTHVPGSKERIMFNQNANARRDSDSHQCTMKPPVPNGKM